jgi:hypothetical protein
MTTQHTPTPWKTETPKGWEQKGLTAIWSDGVMVATCGRQGTQEQQDNAAFIVRACNSHDALVAALEIAVERLESVQAISGQHYDFVAALTRARIALKLARR